MPKKTKIKATAKKATAKKNTSRKTAPKKKATKKTKKRVAKKTAKKSQPNQTAVKEASIEELEAIISQLPEDKYTEILWQKELKKAKSLKQQKNPSFEQTPEPKKKGSKLHLWLLVASTFAVIVIFWIATIQFDMTVDKPASGSSFNEFSDDLKAGLDSLKDSVGSLEQGVDSLEQASEQENINAIINNPNNLSEEEINAMEEKVFPQLKE